MPRPLLGRRAWRERRASPGSNAPACAGVSRLPGNLKEALVRLQAIMYSPYEIYRGGAIRKLEWARSIAQILTQYL